MSLLDSKLSIGVACHSGLGGSGIVATEVGLGLARRGHRIHFIGAERPARLEVGEANVVFHRVEPVDYPLFDQHLFTIALASKMVEVSKSAKLDLLHVHYALPHAVSGYLAKQALGATSPKLVTTLHGTDVTVVGKRPSFQPMVKLAIDGSDAVTTPSAFLRDAALALGATPALPIEVIPNFVDTAHFQPDPKKKAEWLYRLCASQSTRVLTHVSNFRPIKRVQDVVRIFAVVAKSEHCVLFLVGDGPERATAEREVEAAGLSGRVHFFGARADVVPLLQASDVFLLPSESESFGLAALEAQSCGVPVVGARVGGVPEVILDGHTGLLAPVYDVEQMGAHVLSLFREPSRHQAFSTAARNRALTLFPREAAVARYEAAYRRLR